MVPLNPDVKRSVSVTVVLEKRDTLVGYEAGRTIVRAQKSSKGLGAEMYGSMPLFES